MKNYIFLLFLIKSAFGFAQGYDFLPKTYVEIDKWKYIDLLNKTPKPQVDYLLENGKTYTQAYVDSIKKTKDSDRMSAVYLSDSVANKAAVVLRMRTDAEIKAGNKEFFDLQKKETSNRKKLVGSIADLKLTDISGQQHTSESLAGKLIFLNFWFTKCAPCIQEMPDLNKLKEKFGTDGIAYFAITYDKNNLVEQFLDRHKLDFTVIPNDRKTIDQFGVNFYPTNILLDQNRKVLFVNEIFNPKSNNGLEEISKLIKKHKNKL